MSAQIDELLAFRTDHLAWPAPPDLVEYAGAKDAYEYLSERKLQIERADIDPLSHGYVPKIWKTVQWHINDLRQKHPSGVIKIVVIGGNRCLRGDTKIYDPVAKRWDRIDEIKCPFFVWAWDGTKPVIAWADTPFKKGRGKMLKVTLSNGASFCGAQSHRVYTAQGWRDLSQLRVGSSLLRPRSTADISQLVHASDVQHYAETARDCRSGYPSGYRSYDVQPLWVGADDRDIVPLPNDAPIRNWISDSIRRKLWRLVDYLHADKWDDPGRISLRIPTGIRRDLLSILDALLLTLGLFAGTLYRVFCIPCKSISALYVDQWCSQVDPKFADGFDHPESIPEYFPPGSRYGYDETYVTKIESEGIDVKWDFTVPAHGNYILGGVIHHNSSKTRFASNHVLRAIVNKNASRWWCCDSTEAQSRSNQMRLLMEQFPPAWRNLDRDEVTDVRYTLSDGFPKNIFITPNKSEVSFKFYSMDIGNLPGPELDGIWADELIPLEWVKTLNFRLVNRNGIFLITFTPELGWNETYGYFFEGAQILEEVEAELCPRYNEDGTRIGFRKVPRVMQCQDPLARIIFFHTADNPFGNYEGLKIELKDKSEEGNDGILIRAYGVCERGTTAAFRMFNRRAHVITCDQFRAIEKAQTGGVRWHLVDPCDGRNWFMIWVCCPEPDKWIIYREWPSYGYPKAYIEGAGMPGPWTLTGAAADGVKGAAQSSLGFSLERYKEEIEQKEGDDKVFARYIDSRYATSPRTTGAAVTNLQEQLEAVGIDFMTMVPGKGRIIGGENNDGSVDMINSALFYDVETELGQFSAKYAKLNVPQLQIVETCPNVIYALEHWTGMDGQKGACKDPIDCIRGMFLSQVNFVDAKLNSWVGGGIPR